MTDSVSTSRKIQQILSWCMNLAEREGLMVAVASMRIPFDYAFNQKYMGEL
jgi:hypothetical protein